MEDLVRRLDEMQERIARMSRQMEDFMEAFRRFEEFGRQRACQRKATYHTEKHIRTVINGIKKEGSKLGDQLRYYKCEYCHKYHLTKQTDEE